jgi:ribosomal protein L11 methyltransferase
MAKTWIELKVDIPQSLGEAVSNFLIEQGSPGLVQEKVPGRAGRQKERIVAYFPHDRSFPARERKIRTYLFSLGDRRPHFSLRHRLLPEEKWAEAWKANFRPLHATPRIVVKPPWEKYPEKRGEIVIEIDPGMAFGTGTHPSTRLCLRALEDLIPYFPHPPAVLDVGTGSGILAIAALKLGAKEILAVDIDPVAVACARQNAVANQAGRRIDFRVSSPAGLRRVFDIVVANLLPQEILRSALPLSKRVGSRGVLIVSGVLRGQKREVAAAFAERGLAVWDSRELKGWVCLVLHGKQL